MSSVARTLGWSNTPQAWQERGGLLVLVAGPLLLWWFGPRLTTSQTVLAWGGLALLVGVLLRRGWVHLFGPVLFYDMVRSGRRSRGYLGRIAYLCLLFLVLWTMYQGSYGRSTFYGEPLRASDMVEFAERYFATFMWIQFLLAVLLTPAYVAGAIAEEKDRKTLEFLLATDLRNREIVFGKLVSRVCHLILFLIAGLPILSAVQFLGGVDPNLVLCCYAATLVTVLSLAGVSILSSVLTRKARDAIVLAYLFVLVYLVACAFAAYVRYNSTWSNFPSTATWVSPFTVGSLLDLILLGNPLVALTQVFRSGTIDGEMLLGVLRSYGLWHLTVAGVTTGAAVAWVRSVALKEKAVTGRTAGGKTAAVGPKRRPVGNNPMLWKEVVLESGLRMNRVGQILGGLLVLGSFLPLYFILANAASYGRSGSDYTGEMVNVWVRTVGTIAACLGLLSIGVRAAGSVRGEKDKDTFDALLTTPMTNREILYGKWLGAILSVRWLLLWLGVIYALGVALDGLSPLALPMLAASWCAYAAVLAGIGLYYSVGSKSALRATMSTLFTALMLGGGHWLIWMCCGPLLFYGGGPSRGIEELFLLQGAVTPPAVLGGYLPFRVEDYGRMSDPSAGKLFAYSVGGLFVWLLVAAVYWQFACDRFARTTGREVEHAPPAREGA